MTIQSPRQNAYGDRERSIFRALCAYGAVGLSNAAAYAAAEQAQRQADAALAELGSLNNQLEARIAERTETISAAMTSLAEHKRKLQAIVDTALDAVVRIDSQGIIIGWNAQAESLFGWQTTEALGSNLGELIVPHAHRQAHREGMQRYITSGVSRVVDRRIEITALHRSGREIPIELAITRVALEDIHAFEFCAFIRDITQRKQAEEDVRASLEKQRELNQLKARFITMASHEFRTPLATILSSTELLEHYIDRLPANDRADLFRSIGQAVRRMTSMLEDILIIGRDEAERAEFNPQPTVLVPFFERLVEEVRTATHDSYGSSNPVLVNLRDLPDRANVDEKLLRHIFGNLLSNAIKYSPEKTPVEFSARGRDGNLEFTVRDQGIGIPGNDLPRLFESFHRAQNVGNIPGTGLGLAIVKRSVVLHGGSISVDSTPGKGTCFTVKLQA
jgi:PAS domain S-box-containing protein